MPMPPAFWRPLLLKVLSTKGGSKRIQEATAFSVSQVTQPASASQLAPKSAPGSDCDFWLWFRLLRPQSGDFQRLGLFCLISPDGFGKPSPLIAAIVLTRVAYGYLYMAFCSDGWLRF